MQDTTCSNLPVTCRRTDYSYLFDSLDILNALPVEPQAARDFLQPTTLSLGSAENTIAACTTLSITNLLQFADPCRQYEFSLMSTNPSVCWEDVSRNLRIHAELAGSGTLPTVSLRAISSFVVDPDANCLRVFLSPLWWSHATSFTIVGVYDAGHFVDSPCLPATVNVVHMNHTPSNVGQLSMSSKDGDLGAVISAIKDGCSTEESNKQVCNFFARPNSATTHT